MYRDAYIVFARVVFHRYTRARIDCPRNRPSKSRVPYVMRRIFTPENVRHSRVQGKFFMLEQVSYML